MTNEQKKDAMQSRLLAYHNLHEAVTRMVLVEGRFSDDFASRETLLKLIEECRKANAKT